MLLHGENEEAKKINMRASKWYPSTLTWWWEFRKSLSLKKYVKHSDFSSVWKKFFTPPQKKKFILLTLDSTTAASAARERKIYPFYLIASYAPHTQKKTPKWKFSSRKSCETANCVNIFTNTFTINPEIYFSAEAAHTVPLSLKSTQLTLNNNIYFLDEVFGYLWKVRDFIECTLCEIME